MKHSHQTSFKLDILFIDSESVNRRYQVFVERGDILNFSFSHLSGPFYLSHGASNLEL